MRGEKAEVYPTLTYEIGAGLSSDVKVRLETNLPESDGWVPADVTGPQGADVVMFTNATYGCTVTTLQGSTDTLDLDLANDEVASWSVVEAFTGTLESAPPPVALRGAGMAELVDFSVASISSENQAILGRGFTAIGQYMLIIVQCSTDANVFAFTDALILTSFVVSVSRP